MVAMTQDAQVWIEDGYVCIRMPTFPEAHPYDFQIDSCRTPGELTRWLDHLCGKTWFTHDLALELVTLVCLHRGWRRLPFTIQPGGCICR